MKKVFTSFFLTICFFLSVNAKVDSIALKYASKITISSAIEHLTILASNEFEGRESGQAGGLKAAHYIAKEFEKMDLTPPIDGSYFQNIPLINSGSHPKAVSPALETHAPNVLGYLEGSDLKDELVVISAHYDHMGIDANGEIFNGADDNASGTTGIIEIANAFSQSKKAGNGPRRSLLFIAFTAEEKGLLGSKYYTQHPIFPLKNTVTNLNIDMIGRVTPEYKNNPNYIYLIGSDKLSSTLHQISEEVNSKYTKLHLDYKFNSPTDPERIYYRSDHYNFAKNGIPIIFYFDGIHEDYHKVTDTIDKINFEQLIKRARLVFFTAWEVANRTQRLIVDSNKN
jgi:Zn-dependent M28 family amino/carboxypeptidase